MPVLSFLPPDGSENPLITKEKDSLRIRIYFSNYTDYAAFDITSTVGAFSYCGGNFSYLYFNDNILREPFEGSNGQAYYTDYFISYRAIEEAKKYDCGNIYLFNAYGYYNSSGERMKPIKNIFEIKIAKSPIEIEEVHSAMLYKYFDKQLSKGGFW